MHFLISCTVIRGNTLHESTLFTSLRVPSTMWGDECAFVSSKRVPQWSMEMTGLQVERMSIIVQWDATINSFIIFLQTALHVPDDTLIHHQEHIQTVITSGTGRTVFATVRPSADVEGSTSARCCNYSLNVLLMMDEVSSETCTAVCRNIIKLYIVSSCWTIIDIYYVLWRVSPILLVDMLSPHYTYNVVFPIPFSIRQVSGFSVQWLLAFICVRFRCIIKERKIRLTVCLGFVHCLVFGNNTGFRELDLIPP